MRVDPFCKGHCINIFYTLKANYIRYCLVKLHYHQYWNTQFWRTFYQIPCSNIHI